MLGLQIGDIFEQMEEIGLANYCYERVKNLVPENQVNSHELKHLLKKVYNLPEIDEEDEESISCDD